MAKDREINDLKLKIRKFKEKETTDVSPSFVYFLSIERTFAR